MSSTIKSDWLAVQHCSTLKAKRKSLGLTQEALGGKFGVSAPLIGRVERSPETCPVCLYNHFVHLFGFPPFVAMRTDTRNSQQELSFNFEDTEITPTTQKRSHHGKNEGKQLVVYVDDQLHAKITAFAKNHSLTLRETVRRAVITFFRVQEVNYDY